MEDLFQQIANITKAHGYDILCEQVKELKEENEQLQFQVKTLLEDGAKLSDDIAALQEQSTMFQEALNKIDSECISVLGKMVDDKTTYPNLQTFCGAISETAKAALNQ